MAATTAALRLAPGTGLLVRRAQAVLYLPGRDQAVYEAFRSCPAGEELRCVASATIAAGFAVGPFVALAWDDDVHVMAFGDLAVETDQPSLPMLSGAGSRTWVEHALAHGGAAVIEVAASDADAATDLADGVALAGGFRLLLGDVDDDAAVERHAEADDEPGELPAFAPPALAEPPNTTWDPATIAVRRVVADEPAAALAAIQAAAVGLDGAPVTPMDGDPSSALDEDPDVTLPPPPIGELLADVDLEQADRRSSLVEARRCAAGHLNRPGAASCADCAEPLGPVVAVPRPSLGRLRLDDGEEIELDDELLIGRNPERDGDADRTELRRVKVAGDKVSRSHVEVRLQGWDVLVADCGSTNGTFVVAAPGAAVTALEPGHRQLVEAGATVYFGSRSFTVEGGR